ncbi:hypothetical protein BGZ68_002710 [Mortierella alpina]|nr:hypothetical protein BGZ68_002710 [Mortierella alpina]
MLEVATHRATILLLRLLNKMINTLDHKSTKLESNKGIQLELQLLENCMSNLTTRLKQSMTVEEDKREVPSSRTRKNIRLAELAHLERIRLAELAHLEGIRLAELAHLERLAELAHLEKIRLAK